MMSKNKIYIAIGVIVAFVVLVVACFLIFPSGTKTTSKNDVSTEKDSEEKGEKKEDMAGDVTAVIDIKDYGKITVELNSEQAPITVENFVNLAENGFYDGLTFHRIIEGFMMQGGDPLGNGTGGSDENIKGEFAMNGVDNKLSHTKGAISMARSQDPDSASSQFFICHEDATFLDGQYACFGYVTDGLDVVNKVCTEAEPVDDNGTIMPDDQPVINSITIKK